MNELDKIRRVAARAAEGAPHEVLLVLDATVGQNGVQQAREFTSVAGVTGIVLTKLDGTAKGGVAVAIAHDLKLPIRYVGVGEGHRRPDSVLARRNTSTRCSRRSGSGVTRLADDDAAGCGGRSSTRGAASGARRRTRSSAPASSPTTASSSGRARTSAPASRTPRSTRSTRRATRARGATLYCTLEPCAHTAAPARAPSGSSPPAFAASSPRWRIRSRRCSGRGFARLREHGIEVDGRRRAATRRSA